MYTFKLATFQTTCLTLIFLTACQSTPNKTTTKDHANTSDTSSIKDHSEKLNIEIKNNRFLEIENLKEICETLGKGGKIEVSSNEKSTKIKCGEIKTTNSKNKTKSY